MFTNVLPLQILPERFIYINPPGTPHLPKFRLVDICAEGNLKKAIVESSCNSSRKLQIVIGTTAFGMGLDCPNVRQIIYWGPLFVVYIQQMGWEAEMGFFLVYLCTTQMLTIDGCQSK